MYIFECVINVAILITYVLINNISLGVEPSEPPNMFDRNPKVPRKE